MREEGQEAGEGQGVGEGQATGKSGGGSRRWWGLGRGFLWGPGVCPGVIVVQQGAREGLSRSGRDLSTRECSLQGGGEACEVTWGIQVRGEPGKKTLEADGRGGQEGGERGRHSARLQTGCVLLYGLRVFLTLGKNIVSRVI